MRKVLMLVLPVWIACSVLSRADQILVEAESFAEPGGWVLDTQFIHLMGSPYLLAHGLGKPVADATTTVKFPSPGEYRVWVRTKDWVAQWKAPGQPGRFQLLVDGQPLAEAFGTQGAEWSWQSGGAVNITNAVLMYVRDDSLDFSDGYMGTIENALVIQSAEDGNWCIELDNIGKSQRHSAEAGLCLPYQPHIVLPPQLGSRLLANRLLGRPLPGARCRRAGRRRKVEESGAAVVRPCPLEAPRRAVVRVWGRREPAGGGSGQAVVVAEHRGEGPSPVLSRSPPARGELAGGRALGGPGQRGAGRGGLSRLGIG